MHPDVRYCMHKPNNPSLRYFRHSATQGYNLSSSYIDALTLGIILAVFAFFIGSVMSYSLLDIGGRDQSAQFSQTNQTTIQSSYSKNSGFTLQSTASSARSQGVAQRLVAQERTPIVLISNNPNDNIIVPANQQRPDVLVGGTSYRIARRMRVPITAYSSTVDQTDSTPFITASNTHVHWGTIAANFLPFKTKVRIPSMFGDKIFIVEDRMNRRYWHRVDIWMPTRQEALNFGLRTLQIEILEEL